MKHLVVTRIDNNILNYTQYTFPIISKYANLCNSNFIELNLTPPIMSDDNLPHFRIMELYNLLDIYDRILVLDADIVINKNCPNIFNIVPETHIGTIFEDVGSRVAPRRQVIADIQKRFGYIGWVSRYINTGVFLVSKCHKEIFTPINGQYWTGWGSDDAHLGYQICKQNHKIHQLDYKWNHMSMFSEDWNLNANRFDSYILHYAGWFEFPDKNSRSKEQIIKDDIEKIYGGLND